MKKIGLMGAMADEIAPLYEKMTNRHETALGGITFYEGTLAGKDVALCCAGMGKAQAAAATQLLCTSFGAGAILFSGIAGNMSGKVGVGDVLVGETVVYHDGTTRMFAQTAPFLEEFTADPALVQAAQAACRAVGVRYAVGKIATGDEFIEDAAKKRAIQEKCAPDCVEMEGAAVAHIAAKNGVPFVILRAVSDNADAQALETINFDLARYCGTAAKISEALIGLL